MRICPVQKSQNPQIKFFNLQRAFISIWKDILLTFAFLSDCHLFLEQTIFKAIALFGKFKRLGKPGSISVLKTGQLYVVRLHLFLKFKIVLAATKFQNPMSSAMNLATLFIPVYIYFSGQNCFLKCNTFIGKIHA